MPLGGDVVRPDWMSASVTARASQRRVEVLSERSETRRVWLHPDGRVQEEISSGPARFKDATASATEGWRAIDTTVVKDAQGVHPVAVPGSVALADQAGDAAVSMVDAAGRGLGVALDGVELPAPVLDGSTVTYRDVVPGVDVRVEVRPAGFELVWLVHSKKGVSELVRRYGRQGRVVLPTTLTSQGDVVPAQASGGVVELRDGKGVARGRLHAPRMWDAADAAVQGRGLPSQAEFVLGTVARKGKKSTASLGISADVAWLNNPARTFPITIDPTYALASVSPAFDTFVQQGYGTDESASSELKLGNNGSGQVARTFMNFDAASFKGKQITSASLSLLETHSWSCTAKPWSSYDAGLATTATRWTAQPSIGTKRATSTQTVGASSSCPDGRVSIDMTAQAKAWSASTATQVGMMLRADNEADPYGWKRFYSNDSSYRPVIGLFYDRAPAAPALPSVGNSAVVGGKTFIAYPTPSLTGVVPSDADGNQVKVDYSRMTSPGSGYGDLLCSTGYRAPGTTASCTSATLADNDHGWIRARANDSMLSSAWSGAKEYWVTLSPPPVPTVTCASAKGSWADAVKPAETCTVTLTAAAATSNSAATHVRYTVDGGAEKIAAVTQPTTTTPTTFQIPKVGGTAGWHTVTVTAQSPVGRQSAKVTYGFGYGTPSMSAPVSGQTTTDVVQVTGQGGPGGTAGQVQWRVAGSTGFLPVPASNQFTFGSDATKVSVSGLMDTTSLVGQADAQGVVVPERVPARLELRVCWTYGGSAKCSPVRRVVRVPHAFGSGFPTSEAGPGQVALWTGELQVSESDADLPSPTSAIGVSRTHNSFAGDVAVAKQVFGPGWVAGLDGGDDGLSASEVVDNTRLDGTIALVSDDGDTLIYTAPARRTAAAFAAGTYEPADDDTASSGITLSVAGSTPVLTLKDEDGVTTRFTATAAPSATADSVFAVTDVTDPATPGKTTYQRDAQGRVTAIIAPVPTGAAACVPGTRTAGCRVLKLTYNTQGLVSQITAQVDTEATDRVLSTYTYNTDATSPQYKTMASQTDVVTGLTTKYAWTGSVADKTLRLAGITPPGQDGFTFTYANNRLDKVTRPLPSSVAAGDRTAQLAAFVYDQPTDVSNLDLAQFDGYPLTRRASKAFAVFGPDQKISGAPAKNDAAWQRANVYLTDGEGYTIHEGSYGAGAWQWTANVYDDKDNIVQAWDARAVEQLRTGGMTDIDSASTQTVYNTDITNATGDVITPAGTLVVQTRGPARTLIDEAGVEVWARPQTDTSYDQGAPHAGINPLSGQPYRLPTTVTTSTVTPGDQVWDRHDLLNVTVTSYDGTTPGGKTGWELGQATSTTTRMGATEAATAGDITRETVYDDQGRIIEQRQPSAKGTSADAGTRKTLYYTAGTHPTVAACGGKPAWAGWVCQTMPGAGTLPTERTVSYTWDGQAAQTQTIAGTATVTTTTSFDAKSRPVTVTTTSAGLTGSTPVPAVTTSYDSVGQVTGTTSTAGSTAMTYDTWGRQLTYTNTPAGQPADTATTTYDELGQVVKVTDNNGSQTFTYDGTDANGKAETRGLVTKTEATSGGITHSATAAYDAQGAATLEKLPGGIIRRHTYDPAGELVDLTYSGKGTDPETGAAVADQQWFGWSSRSDAAGRTVREWSTDGGSAYTDTNSPAVTSDRAYRYDKAGRLVRVDETLNTRAESPTCTRRGYSFDVNGNRTSQTTAANTTGCDDAGATSTARAFNGADQPVTGANGQGSYVYDPLGRQTSIPAADTTNPTRGDMALAYYDSDAAQSVAQGDTKVTFTLDGAGRRLTQNITVGPIAVPGAATGTLTRHYTDSSDNPAWTVDVRGEQTVTTRYADLTGDGLGITYTTTGGATTAELALTGLRGDVNATVKLDGTNPATGIDTWADYTEYGQPTTTKTATAGGAAGAGYGWLGAHERATLDALGITLMGARLYNQATGLFTSLDPVHGGNETTYGYPNDPINKSDIDGNWGGWNRLAGGLARVSQIAGYIPLCGYCSAVSAITGYASAAAYYRGGNRRKARRQFASTTVGVALGGFGRFGTRFRGSTKYGKRFAHAVRRGSGRVYRRGGWRSTTMRRTVRTYRRAARGYNRSFGRWRGITGYGHSGVGYRLYSHGVSTFGGWAYNYRR
ncbi:hypothetical protein GCM10027030_11100 [Luteococcus sediminum]